MKRFFKAILKQSRIGVVWACVSGEYAAVMLRVSRRSKGHYGPLRRREAEVRPECDAMFASVQSFVNEHPHHCQFLLNY